MAASSSTMSTLSMRGLARGGLRFLLRSQWNFNDKACANREILFHTDGAVMVFDDAAHDGESESGAALFGGEVWQEKFLLEFGGHAVTGIGDDQLDRFAAI